MLGFLHTIPWWATLLLLPFVIIVAIVAKVAEVLGLATALCLTLFLGLLWTVRRHHRQRRR
jgi:hypothetical protein